MIGSIICLSMEGMRGMRRSQRLRRPYGLDVVSLKDYLTSTFLLRYHGVAMKSLDHDEAILIQNWTQSGNLCRASQVLALPVLVIDR